MAFYLAAVALKWPCSTALYPDRPNPPVGWQQGAAGIALAPAASTQTSAASQPEGQRHLRAPNAGTGKWVRTAPESGGVRPGLNSRTIHLPQVQPHVQLHRPIRPQAARLQVPWHCLPDVPQVRHTKTCLQLVFCLCPSPCVFLCESNISSHTPSVPRLSTIQDVSYTAVSMPLGVLCLILLRFRQSHRHIYFRIKQCFHSSWWTDVCAAQWRFPDAGCSPDSCNR